MARALSLAFLLAAALIGCGSQQSSADAEDAIASRSQGRLSRPDCAGDAIEDSGGVSFRCSAVEPAGRRVKVQATLMDGDGEALVLVWPCVSAKTPWRAINERPELRCGVPVGRRGYWRR